ncbi:uncharacterized protein [Amphiura filiformis]|uniref:uncharacterized protein n=1 Tax=Amphiura filiformis TaxID=82378 RepID=UPI003B21594F
MLHLRNMLVFGVITFFFCATGSLPVQEEPFSRRIKRQGLFDIGMIPGLISDCKNCTCSSERLSQGFPVRVYDLTDDRNCSRQVPSNYKPPPCLSLPCPPCPPGCHPCPPTTTVIMSTKALSDTTMTTHLRSTSDAQTSTGAASTDMIATTADDNPSTAMGLSSAITDHTFTNRNRPHSTNTDNSNTVSSTVGNHHTGSQQLFTTTDNSYTVLSTVTSHRVSQPPSTTMQNIVASTTTGDHTVSEQPSTHTQRTIAKTVPPNVLCPPIRTRPRAKLMYRRPCRDAQGTCVYKFMWCDGKNDCPNGADEQLCS